MKAWAVVAPSEPLQSIELPTPEPTGTEVLIEVTHCGVCHSDLHFWKGEYDMGGGQIMKLAERGVTLPRAPGHEVAGRVAAKGGEAEGVALGDVRVVYPWLGCGACSACLLEQDNLCSAQKSIGVVRHGGFASHVLVPHPRYLVDPGEVELALAATYACSGITAYAATSKILPLDPDAPVALIGAGGVGLTTIAMLRARGHRKIISVDVSSEKLAAAEAAGAIAVDGSAKEVGQRILAAAGGPLAAAIDFVGISSTARDALEAVGKGGKLVIVGVGGGELKLSLTGMVFRAISVIGSNTGSPSDLRAVMALARDGLLAPTPVLKRSCNEANEALQDLKYGRVTGRQVLVHD